MECNDNNPCTKDRCDPQQGCIHEDQGGPCDDGNVCTKNDQCQGTQCQGENKECPDGQACKQPDGCDAKDGCRYIHRAGACNDGDQCNGPDACKDGVCKPTGDGEDCSDNNACTDDSCVPGKGCDFKPNTKPCEDNNPCTKGGTCSGGSCKAGKEDCDDGNVCTNDSCEGDKCQHEAVDPDGKKCATSKACYQGKCVAVIKGMKLIGGGNTVMGCVTGDTQCLNNEKPNHQVTLTTFVIDETEVSVSKYKVCVDQGKCTAPDPGCSTGAGGTWGLKDKQDHPVNCVTWAQANAYCKWRMPNGGRLPTEAEWEHVQRNKQKGLIYPWGNAMPPPKDTGNLPDATAKAQNANWQTISGYTDGYVYTAPVSFGLANAYGLRGVYGNVWEWIHDFYSDTYYSQSNGAKNPSGPGTGTGHVTRGPGFFWSNNGVALRTSYRLNMPLNHLKNDLGFRCARQYP